MQLLHQEQMQQTIKITFNQNEEDRAKRRGGGRKHKQKNHYNPNNIVS
jgi:hypothetical protein